ncbi:signal peptide peptidase SppA [Desulfolutivibrio sulfoxidireducens]|uniref:signal peptide peptidase SppA n=1 Tax=Desulfolutivibrio sulfoxidireducens TaxID=2773299 RepID=UPI00159E1C83|nr:signal peptide peptidase SppA [Desulfolutivibrio sulfoxidireducens]QLA18656.1 signal peptide peptidase SppA [Desulfolutivibrio sulfoxidireducens]
MPSSGSFPGRHPALFVVLLIVAVVVLFFGAMVATTFFSGDDDEGGGLFAARQRLGLVRLEGFLGDAEPVVTFLKELREDKTVLGVILRINSPGGAFGPSQEIFQAVARLAAVKPVVASMSSVAASGGYYAACPARKIFANPGTLTGSIGVMAQYPNVRELLDKIGVSVSSMASGDLKTAGSPFAELKEADRTYLEGIITDLNAQFQGDVVAARKLSPEAVAVIADGRAMTGQRALALGLVDALGGLEDAEEAVKDLTGLAGKKVPFVSGPKRKRGVLEWLFGRRAEGPGLDDAAALVRLLARSGTTGEPGGLPEVLATGR